MVTVIVIVLVIVMVIPVVSVISRDPNPVTQLQWSINIELVIIERLLPHHYIMPLMKPNRSFSFIHQPYPSWNRHRYWQQGQDQACNNLPHPQQPVEETT